MVWVEKKQDIAQFYITKCGGFLQFLDILSASVEQNKCFVLWVTFRLIYGYKEQFSQHSDSLKSNILFIYQLINFNEKVHPNS